MSEKDVWAPSGAESPEAAIAQAMALTASMRWEDGVFDRERALWVAEGLAEWLERFAEGEKVDAAFAEAENVRVAAALADMAAATTVAPERLAEALRVLSDVEPEPEAEEGAPLASGLATARAAKRRAILALRSSVIKKAPLSKPDRTAINHAGWAVGDVLVWRGVFLPKYGNAARIARENGLVVYVWAAVHIGDGLWSVTGRPGKRTYTLPDLARVIFAGSGYSNPDAYRPLSLSLLENGGESTVWEADPSGAGAIAEGSHAAASERLPWRGGPVPSDADSAERLRLIEKDGWV